MTYDTSELQRSEEWTCTDPNTGQFVRPVGGYDRSFEVYEASVDHASTYYVGSMTIYQVEKAIDGFYDSLEELVSAYSKNWPQIVAECQSEKNAPAMAVRS